LLCLALVLLYGFALGRFSEVLVLAGYSRSPRETFQRFKHTTIHIMKWMHSDLSDPKSIGRRSITQLFIYLSIHAITRDGMGLQVRSIHAFARKRSMAIWTEAKAKGDTNIGIPLSQYDLAQVQIAFSGSILDFFKNELNSPVSDEDSDAWIHLWRYIGFRLGIEDAFNACKSTNDCLDITADLFFAFPLYSRQLRPSCKEMVRSTLEGFGTYLGLGNRLFASMMIWVCQKRKFLDPSHLDIPPHSLLGLYVVWLFANSAHYPWLRQQINRGVRNGINFENNFPHMVNRIETLIMRPVSYLTDFGWWLGGALAARPGAALLLVILMRKYASQYRGQTKRGIWTSWR